MIWIAVALAVAAFAVWGWCSARSVTDFFVASRSAGAILAGLGGTAAGLSAFVFVGGPGLFAAIGAASLWIVASAPLTGALQCWAVGEPIVALAERHGSLTVPDLLAARFGEGWPRGLAAAAVVTGGVATLAVQVKGVAVVAGVLGGIPGPIVAIAAIGATAIYTATGGMRAGLLAEAAQGLVMAAAAIVLAGAVLARAGGPARAIGTLRAARPELLDAWGVLGATPAIGLFLLFALGTCAQPHYLQKFLLLRDRAALRWMPLVMTVALLSVLTVWVGVGLGGTALAVSGELRLGAPDELAPALLRGALPASLGLLAIVAVLGAVMSTAASLLNLVAAAVTRDLPLAIGKRPPRGLGSARVATVAAAATAAGLALVSQRPVALLGVLGWGAFTAALLAPVLVGLNWRGATRRGAVAAMAVGPAVQLALEAARSAGAISPSVEPGLSGAAVAVVALVVFSRQQQDGVEAAT